METQKKKNAQGASDITLAAATFPLPYYNLAFKNYKDSTGVSITYGGIGSGGGILLDNQNILKMLALTGNMTQNAIFAFTCADIQLARETIEMDHQVDQLHHAICDSLRSQYSGRTLTNQNMTDILSVNGMSYNMERIGNNATNIAEATIYLVEGKNIKHWDNPNKDEILEAGSEG